MGGEPHVARPVLFGAVLRVRQPLHPVPVFGLVVARADRDLQVIGGVEGDELGQDRAHQLPAGLGVPAQLHLREPAQEDRGRQVVDGAVRADEAAQPLGRERFEVLHWLALRRRDGHGQLLGDQADPDLGEVGVRHAALPQPAAHRHRPQAGRVGVPPHHRGALLGGGVAHLLADLSEVTQVIAALAAHSPLAFSRGSAHLPESHGQHADRHQGHRDQRDAAAVAHEHQHHGAGADCHRQIHEKAADAPARRFGKRRGFLQGEFSAWHVRRSLPSWSAEQRHAHRDRSFLSAAGGLADLRGERRQVVGIRYPLLETRI